MLSKLLRNSFFFPCVASFVACLVSVVIRPSLILSHKDSCLFVLAPCKVRRISNSLKQHAGL